jgi:hypothetical protein
VLKHGLDLVFYSHEEVAAMSSSSVIPWFGTKNVAFVPVFRDSPDVVPPDVMPDNWRDVIMDRVVGGPPENWRDGTCVELLMTLVLKTVLCVPGCNEFLGGKRTSIRKYSKYGKLHRKPWRRSFRS